MTGGAGIAAAGRAFVIALLSLAPLAAQDAFKGRLSPIPVDSSTVTSITGSGSVTASLAGRTLTVTGTFEGLKSPATIAQIHLGPKGVRGPVLFDLTVTKATSGTLSGTFMLTQMQVDDLRKSRFYVLLHSEKAPDGNLWGWILP
jgi:hypothetical protein